MAVDSDDDKIASPVADDSDLPSGRAWEVWARFEVLPRWPTEVRRFTETMDELSSFGRGSVREDAQLLGRDGRTEIVKAALELLHRRAAEERMARSVDELYGDRDIPLPIGAGPARATNRPISLPEPFRGEVWDVEFDDFGLHSAVVLSINTSNVRLGHVAVVPVTRTAGPLQTYIPFEADA